MTLNDAFAFGRRPVSIRGGGSALADSDALLQVLAAELFFVFCFSKGALNNGVALGRRSVTLSPP